MKIGLTIRTFNPASGGLQAHAQMLLQGLRARGHEVRVATRALEQSQKWADYYRISEPPGSRTVDGIPVSIISGCTGANELLWLAGKCVVRPRLHFVAERLAKTVFAGAICEQFRDMDIIHHVGQAHELIGFGAAVAARRMNVPFLVQPTFHPGQWGDSAFDLRLYAKARQLMAYTHYEKNALSSLGLKQRCVVVGTGIPDCTTGNASRFRERYGISGQIVLFLGRKSIDKGFPLLTTAFSDIAKSNPDATLVVMGPPGGAGVDDPSLVLDLGFTTFEEKHDALAACDFLCVPSEGESFGLVYMEAARYAKPSVARNLPVLRELLGKHDAIVLAGDGDSSLNQVSLNAEELASCIKRLLDNPTDARRIGENAKKASEAFLWPNVIQKFESAYEAAIEQQRC
ncbi:MAG TPA: hypothetical protein DDZ51_07995 [Planctomycetaceae bacterium]|nr:hypothetical protein [Planctomycetaceae bacterium]